MSNNIAPILMAGSWQAGAAAGAFNADNPSTGQPLQERYPVSTREDVLKMLEAGSEAADALRVASPEKIAGFLEAFAAGIEQRADALVEIAHAETGVAVSPAMNHGGPYPATGHPGFTAVGIPASIRRFVALHCYDNLRSDRLPTGLVGPSR